MHKPTASIVALEERILLELLYNYANVFQKLKLSKVYSMPVRHLQIDKKAGTRRNEHVSQTNTYIRHIAPIFAYSHYENMAQGG